MTEAFEAAWGSVQNPNANPHEDQIVGRDGVIYIVRELDNVNVDLEPQNTVGSCCEALQTEFQNIFGHGTPFEIENGMDYALPILESQYGFTPNYAPPQTHTRADGTTFEFEYLEFDWYDGMDCDKVIHFFRNHIQSDLEDMTASQGQGPWTTMLNDALDAIQAYESCERGESGDGTPGGGLDPAFGMGDDMMVASNDCFEDAWNVAKMPIEMVEEGESRGLFADRVWQGRRAGQPDTGYWTPHKDKAVAYSLYGPRFGYDWGGGVDASKEIPELWSYAPRGREQWPPDNEYVNPGDEGLEQAHEARRIAFKRDDEWDPETRSFHQNYPYIEPERMTRMPDADFADIIERIMARQDTESRQPATAYAPGRRYPPEIIGADEWGEVFGADIHDEDGLSWDNEELYDLVSGFWDPENVEWDLSTNDFPLAEGTTLQMYVDALRGRNQ